MEFKSKKTRKLKLGRTLDQASGSGISPGLESPTDVIKKIIACSNSISSQDEGVVALDLPRIVVIGSQSVGKSSVLESIIGKTILPRGSDMVTRCPIEIQLLKRADLKLEEAYALFPKDNFDPKVKVEEFQEVPAEIIKRTDRRAPKHQISQEPVIVQIHSPDVMDLQLIDLPGFVQVPLDSQPSDLTSQVEALVTKFTKKLDTLILAISDAGDDIVNSVALKHAIGVDPKGKRTLGVVSKLDKVAGAEKEKSLLRVLKNETLPLAKGYVGVINANETQVKDKISLDEIREAEMEFYKTKSIFFGLWPRIGIGYLREILHKDFLAVIKARLPEIIAKAEDELQKTEEKLNHLNYTSDGKTTPRDRVEKFISEFCKRVETALKGNTICVSVDQVDAGAILRKTMKTQVQIACAKAMDFDCGASADMMLHMLINLQAIKDPVVLNEDAFLKMVETLTEKFSQPFTHLVGNVERCLSQQLEKMAQKIFQTVPNLKDAVLELLLDEVDEFKKLCIHNLMIQIDIQKIFINAHHLDFKKDFIKPEPMAERCGDQDESATGVPLGLGQLRSNLFKKLEYELRQKLTKDTSDEESEASELSYISDKGEFLGVALRHLEMVLYYMTTVDKNLCDSAQKFIIFFLVEKLLTFVRSPQFLHLYQNELTEENYNYLLSSNAQQEIDFLLKRKVATKQALDILKSIH